MLDLHVHTTFSDGKNSPEEVVLKALELGYGGIALCEHIRAESMWFTDYLSEVTRLRRKYSNYIRIYTALESKIIDHQGGVDARQEFFDVDIFYAAVHRIALGENLFSSGVEDRALLKEAWLDSLIAALRNNRRIKALAHPLFPAAVYGIEINITDITFLQNEIIRSGKAVELNVKHAHPMDKFFLAGLKNKVPIIIGSDSHSVQDMKTSFPLIKQMNVKWRKCIGSF